MRCKVARWLGCRNKQNRLIITKSIYIIDYMQTWSANQLRNRWLAGWHGVGRRVFRESRSPARLIGHGDKLWPSRAEQGKAGQRRAEKMRCKVAGLAAGINKID